MAWIESHHTLRNHPKVFLLCKELKIERAQAIGHLHMLWWWAIENRENGDLIGLFPRDIAQACDWPGDGQKLLKALQKCGWVGKDMRLHDWMKYAGRLIHERAKYQRRKGKHTGEHTGDYQEVTRNTQPNPTQPNRLKDKNGDFFSKEDQKRIEKRILEVRGTPPESMSTGLALIEFTKIVKEKKPKDPVAYIIGILNNEASTNQRSAK